VRLSFDKGIQRYRALQSMTIADQYNNESILAR
jgi:hypothetical protein